MTKSSPATVRPPRPRPGGADMSASDVAAMDRAHKAQAKSLFEGFARSPFDKRGFTARMIVTLESAGIEYPENLLNMTEQEIKKIPGIKKDDVVLIRAYRERFSTSK